MNARALKIVGILIFSISSCSHDQSNGEKCSLNRSGDAVVEQERSLIAHKSPSLDNSHFDTDQRLDEPSNELSETFLGKKTPWMIAVVDFSCSDRSDAAAGQVAAAQIRTRLPGRWFSLVERTQLAKVLQERDLHDSGTVGRGDEDAISQMTGASLLLLGNVTIADGLIVEARIVDASTGEIVRQSVANGNDLRSMDSEFDSIVGVLSAPDHLYRRMGENANTRIEKHLRQSLRDPVETRQEGGQIVIVVRKKGEDLRIPEARLYREVRQQAREAYATFCQSQLGTGIAKSELMDYCRDREECEDVVTRSGIKEFVFRVPLPPHIK